MALMLKQSLAEEDTRIALMVAWGVGLPVITAFSFYFGTVAVSKHLVDLQLHDLQAAGIFAVGGAILGTILALAVTFIYPRVVVRDLHREGHHAELDEHGAAPELVPNVGPGDLRH
ncbi:MAG: hypothetical protein C4320_03145 [Armatimonadota bacterium]